MENIEFVWWGAFLLLPLPLLVYKLIPSVKQRHAIYLPNLPTQSGSKSPFGHTSRVLAIVVWLMLVTATARPVWYGEPVTVHTEHRDLMLVVDLSYSMNQADMKHNGDYIDRLSAVKQVLSQFVENREGDRLGLVLFADHAYLQTPLTLDRRTISEQINQMVLRLIGDQTAIGDGIGLATKTFIDSDAPQRVMVLLSDGSNNSGVLDPIEAAEIAQQYGTTIYTVGVGAGEMEVRQFFSTRTVNTAHDLDEKTLEEIATMTGGQYFRARNADELANIYDTIDALEPINEAKQTWRPQQEWFGLPLTIALFFSIVLLVMRRNHV